MDPDMDIFAITPDLRRVTAFQNLSLADRDRTWSASAAVKRVRAWASSDGSGDKDTIDWAKYRKAFVMYDAENQESFGGYKLPIADVIDGTLTAIPKGLFAAAAVLQGARGGVEPFQAGDIDKSKSHVGRYYKKMAKKFGDDDLVPPWEEEQSDIVIKRFGEDGYELTTEPNGIRHVTLDKAEHLRLYAPINLREVVGEDDELELSFSSEAGVKTCCGLEFLPHMKGNASVTRLKQVGAILKNHDPNQIVGTPLKVWIDEKEGKGKLRMKFGTTPKAQEAKQEVNDRSLRGVSVGFVVGKWIWLPDKNTKWKEKFAGPAWVADSWEALEASLTPIPADPTVGVNRSIDITEGEGTSMPPEKGKQTTPDPEPVPAVAPAAPAQRDVGSPPPEPAPAPAVAAVEGTGKQATEEAVKAERQRTTDITQLCRAHKMSNEFTDNLVNSGADIAKAREQVLTQLSQSQAAIVPGGSVEVTADERAKRITAISDGIRLRQGTVKAEDAEKSGGNTYANMSLMEIARECLERNGVNTRLMSKMDLAGAALQGPRVMNSSCFRSPELYLRETIGAGTDDFPFILANTANKELLDGFRAAATTWRSWAKAGSLQDFKQGTRIKLSEVGDLELIPENGNYNTTDMSESRETIQLATYGKKFSISRQAIINDDLQAFTTIPNRMGRAASRKPNTLAVTVLLANANLSDGAALFSSTHRNRNAETDYRLDTLAHAKAGIENLVKLFRQQQMKMADGEEDSIAYIDITPKVMLLGPTYEMNARTALRSAGSLVDNKNVGVENPISELGIQPVIEPNIENTNITGYSSTAYYIFGDPNDIPVIEVAFLQGTQEPAMEEIQQTDADGRIWKVRLDCVAAAVDFLGAVTETGVDD